MIVSYIRFCTARNRSGSLLLRKRFGLIARKQGKEPLINELEGKLRIVEFNHFILQMRKLRPREVKGLAQIIQQVRFWLRVCEHFAFRQLIPPHHSSTTP